MSSICFLSWFYSKQQAFSELRSVCLRWTMSGSLTCFALRQLHPLHEPLETPPTPPTTLLSSTSSTKPVRLLPDTCLGLLMNPHQLHHRGVPRDGFILHEPQGWPSRWRRDEELPPHRFKELSDPELVLFQVLHVVQPVLRLKEPGRPAGRAEAGTTGQVLFVWPPFSR